MDCSVELIAHSRKKLTTLNLTPVPSWLDKLRTNYLRRDSKSVKWESELPFMPGSITVHL